MKIVVALGGNALLQRGEALSYANQLTNVKKAALSLRAVAQKHQLALVHGNGPQVGLIALQNEAYKEIEPYPFDVLGAESQGMIGHMLQLELDNLVKEKQTVTMLTRVVVDPSDEAFKNPTKFIGPVYDEPTSKKLTQEKNWHFKADTKGFRRVVPSPQPKEIVELKAITTLLDRDFNLICCGGGGIPVKKNTDHTQGIEAVIDKDRAACLLAKSIKADMFIILSDVSCVYEDFGKTSQKGVHYATLDYLKSQGYASGSMGPKVEAVMDYVSHTGNFAAIGSLEELGDIIEKKAGTLVQKTGNVTYY